MRTSQDLVVMRLALSDGTCEFCDEGHVRPRIGQGRGQAVSDWPTAELDRIGAADELEIAARRSDGS
jgi:hypothetical protein